MEINYLRVFTIMCPFLWNIVDAPEVSQFSFNFEIFYQSII